MGPTSRSWLLYNTATSGSNHISFLAESQTANVETPIGHPVQANTPGTPGPPRVLEAWNDPMLQRIPQNLVGRGSSVTSPSRRAATPHVHQLNSIGVGVTATFPPT